MEQRDKVYLHNDLRRARERAAYVEPVLRLVVFDRDGWECHECGGICDPHGPRAERPSLDHLVPLSEGGAHSYDNVATAHVGCNSRRYHLGRKRPDSPIPEVVG